MQQHNFPADAPKGRWVFVPDVPPPEEQQLDLSTTSAISTFDTTIASFSQIPEQYLPQTYHPQQQIMSTPPAFGTVPSLTNSPRSFIAPSPPETPWNWDTSFDGPLLFPSGLEDLLDLDTLPDLPSDLHQHLNQLAFEPTPQPESTMDMFSLGLTATTSPPTAATSSFHTTPASVPLPTPTFSPAALPTSSFPDNLQPIQPASPLQPAAPTPRTTTTTTPPKPNHSCPHCPTSFLTQSHLNKHLRKHTKPHRCPLPECAFGSADARGLERHLWAAHRAYAEEKGVRNMVVRCEVPGCGYEGRGDNARRHFRTRHVRARAQRKGKGRQGKV